MKEKVTDCDIEKLVTLPSGLDFNEWLATHSKCYKFNYMATDSEIIPDMAFEAFSCRIWPTRKNADSCWIFGYDI